MWLLHINYFNRVLLILLSLFYHRPIFVEKKIKNIINQLLGSVLNFLINPKNNLLYNSYEFLDFLLRC
jgi:hypothetical protein